MVNGLHHQAVNVPITVIPSPYGIFEVSSLAAAIRPDTSPTRNLSCPSTQTCCSYSPAVVLPAGPSALWSPSVPATKRKFLSRLSTRIGPCWRMPLSALYIVKKTRTVLESSYVSSHMFLYRSFTHVHQTPRRINSRDNLQFDLVVSLPKSSSPRFIRAFETSLPLFVHMFEPLERSFEFGSVSLSSSNAPITIKVGAHV